jgi:hypothetical protein
MSSGYDIPAGFAGRLRIGACSWKYDSWKGLVYDPGRGYRPEDYLADYARHFATVEIDQWFYSLIVTCWAEILKGPPISTFATRGFFTSLGSGHRSVQMPPQPYSELMLRS